jgi:amino acid permease
VACLSRGRIDNVSYAYKPISKTDLLFRIFNALGQISFAFAGHAVTLEIQATIPSTPEKPSRVPMWKGALGAYFINAICYFPVAIIGYWAFGQDVNDNVLMSLQKSSWLIASANLMVFIHVVGSYQVSMFTRFRYFFY